MKVLVYEDNLHNKSLFHYLSRYFEEKNIPFNKTRSKLELEKLITENETDFIIIHHRKFDYPKSIKEKYPSIKLIGYSAFVSDPFGINKCLIDMMLEVYEDVFGSKGALGDNIIPNYQKLDKIFGDKK